MRIYLKEGIAEVPSTFQLDFTAIPNIQDSNGPHWLSCEAWVHTADLAVSGSSFVVNTSWIDPAGDLQTTDNSQFSLGAGTPGHVPTKVMTVNRQTGSSLWLFDATLFGLPGDALVSWRIMFTSADLLCDFNGWD